MKKYRLSYTKTYTDGEKSKGYVDFNEEKTATSEAEWAEGRTYGKDKPYIASKCKVTVVSRS